MENQNKSLLLIEDLGMLYPTETSKNPSRYGLYRCFCGVEFKTQISRVKIKGTQSCGCLVGGKSTINGLSRHRLYNIWQHMINRCNNVNADNYKYYGAVGVVVCDEWLFLENFIRDMDSSFIKGLTLDRINNNEGYSKDNCRWVSQSIQMRNTRRLITTNTSGYRGVSFHKRIQKFTSRICVNSKQIHLGYFKDPIEAAKAYDSYVIKNNLEHTRNFN